MCDGRHSAIRARAYCALKTQKGLDMSDTRTQIAAVLFQPVPGGYVYREPFRWFTKTCPHYLVDEQQKSMVLAIMTPRRPVLWQVGFWSMLCAMVAIACVAMWAYSGHDSPTLTDTAGIAVLTIAQLATAFALLRWRKLRRLRPLLATLPRTDLQISQSEMRKAATNAMSGRQLAIALAANVFAASAMLLNAALQLPRRDPMGFFWLVLSLPFASLAAYYLRLLIGRTAKAAR